MRRIVEVVGQFVSASNATLLGRDDAGELAVYKPTAGETPLWDFPQDTLAAREVLTYEVAVAMGFEIVPATVFGVGPYGPGSVQQYVDVDETFDPLPLVQAADPGLWEIATLDVICNNADRKLGHIISAADTGRLYAIDHGLNFNVAPKLRTVLWGFSGVALPNRCVGAVSHLADALQGPLADRVAELLSASELEALQRRVRDLLAEPVHPQPPTDRPAIPWPPY